MGRRKRDRERKKFLANVNPDIVAGLERDGSDEDDNDGDGFESGDSFAGSESGSGAGSEISGSYESGCGDADGAAVMIGDDDDDDGDLSGDSDEAVPDWMLSAAAAADDEELPPALNLPAEVAVQTMPRRRLAERALCRVDPRALVVHGVP